MAPSEIAATLAEGSPGAHNYSAATKLLPGRLAVPMTQQGIASGQYLKSLSAAEELAVFLSARGHCLEATGRLAEAQVAHAHALAPKNAVHLAFLAAAVKKELAEWQRVQVDLGQATPTRLGTNPDPTSAVSAAEPKHLLI